MERKIHMRQNWLIFWGIWGEAELILRIWGAKDTYFRGAEEFSFWDLGRSMHYFQGSREHRPPWGPRQSENVSYRSHIVTDIGGWSGWSVPLLFACNNNRFSRDEAHYIIQHFVSSLSCLVSNSSVF